MAAITKSTSAAGVGEDAIHGIGGGSGSTVPPGGKQQQQRSACTCAFNFRNARGKLVAIVVALLFFGLPVLHHRAERSMPTATTSANSTPLPAGPSLASADSATPASLPHWLWTPLTWGVRLGSGLWQRRGFGITGGIGGGIGEAGAEAGPLGGTPSSRDGTGGSSRGRGGSGGPYSQRRQDLSLIEIDTPLAINDSSCPLEHRKLSLQEVQAGAKPYILGGTAQPGCVNCQTDTLWAKFCQYKSHGPVCADHLQKQLLRDYLRQAEQQQPQPGGEKDDGLPQPSSSSWEAYLTFTPCELWQLIRGRTLMIIGDSQALNFYKALKCFMYEFWDVTLREELPLLPDPQANMAMTDPEGRTVKPQCVAMPQASRICFVRVVKMSFLVQSLLPSLQEVTRPHDAVVFNVGLWHKNREEYSRGLQDFKEFYKLHNRCLPHMFWKDTPMQHFAQTADGGYPFGAAIKPFVCAPLRNVSFHPATHHLVPDPPQMAAEDGGDGGGGNGGGDGGGGRDKLDAEKSALALRGGWRNIAATPVMAELGIPVIDTWNDTYDMWRYHKKPGEETECTHFCHPSAQQLWVWAMYRALANRSADLMSSVEAFVSSTSSSSSSSSSPTLSSSTTTSSSWWSSSQDPALHTHGTGTGSMTAAAVAAWAGRGPSCEGLRVRAQAERSDRHQGDKGPLNGEEGGARRGTRHPSKRPSSSTTNKRTTTMKFKAAAARARTKTLQRLDQIRRERKEAVAEAKAHQKERGAAGGQPPPHKRRKP